MTRFELQQEVSNILINESVMAVYSDDEERSFLNIIRENCPVKSSFFIRYIGRRSGLLALIPKYVLISESAKMPKHLSQRCADHNTTIIRFGNV